MKGTIKNHKHRKMLKIFAASSLAVLMCAGVLCGTIIPMNSAQVGVSGGATSASNSGDPAALAQSADSAQAEWAENILSGDLGLDPENDPVIGTTENGLEIKFHGVALTGEWDYTKFTTAYVTDTFTGSGTFYNLSGYLYITMGTYGGSAVNWIIIGRNSSLNTITCTNTYAQGTAKPAEFIKFSSYSTYANALNSQRETTTPAGSAISSDNSKQIVNTVSGVSGNFTYNLSSYGAPVASDEIPSDCVLCICSKVLYSTYFDPALSVEFANYKGSNLQTHMTNLYSSGLGLTSAQQAQIQAQSLDTLYYPAETITNVSTIDNQYLFPLALAASAVQQNYCIETYLNGWSKRYCAAAFWLRACFYRSVAVVDVAGNYLYDDDNDGTILRLGESCGVRPAFVLKIV